MYDVLRLPQRTCTLTQTSNVKRVQDKYLILKLYQEHKKLLCYKLSNAEYQTKEDVGIRWYTCPFGVVVKYYFVFNIFSIKYNV